VKTTSLIKDTRADKIFLIFVYVFLAISLLIVLYPLIYIVSASISNPHLVNQKESPSKAIEHYWATAVSGVAI